MFSIYLEETGVYEEKCLVAPTLARVRATKRNSKLWTSQLDGRIYTEKYLFRISHKSEFTKIATHSFYF